jgi:fused signal recognition particle receptor
MLRWLSGKIKSGLAKTKGAFTGVFDLLRGKGKVDQHFLDELEKDLLKADAGPQATTVIVDRVRQSFRDKEITGEVEAFVKQQLRDLLAAETPGIQWAASGPTVVMVAGVNGSGKTTSIAKLAKRLQTVGK